MNVNFPFVDVYSCSCARHTSGSPEKIDTFVRYRRRLPYTLRKKATYFFTAVNFFLVTVGNLVHIIFMWRPYLDVCMYWSHTRQLLELVKKSSVRLPYLFGIPNNVNGKFALQQTTEYNTKYSRLVFEFTSEMWKFRRVVLPGL